MAIGAKELNLQNEAPDNRRAVPTLGGGAKVATALEHAVKAAPPVHAGGFFFAHANGALCEADKKGENKFGAEFARCQRNQCSGADGQNGSDFESNHFENPLCKP